MEQKEELLKEVIFGQDEFKGQLAYWSGQIGGELIPTDIPVDFDRSEGRRKKKAAVGFTLPADLSLMLEDFARGSAMSVYISMLTVFKILLFRLTWSPEILVAAPLLKKKGDKRAVHYNRWIFLRDRLNGGQTFKELLLDTRENTLEAYRNQSFPLDMVFRKQGLPFESYSFLYRLVFSMENVHDGAVVRDLDYDLLFSTCWRGGVIEGELRYNCGVLREETVQRYLEMYIRLLRGCLEDVNRKIAGIPMLSAQDRRLLLREWNGVSAAYPRDLTIQQWVDRRTEEAPDRVALVFEDLLFTYGKMTAEANRLARFLGKRGVKPDVVVGVMKKNPPDLVVALLAVLKAGGIYCPIPPDTPHGRVMDILNDGDISVVVTDLDSVSGFSFMRLGGLDKPGRRVTAVVTRSRPPVDDLDSLQVPDRSWINYEKYAPFIGQSMVKNSIAFQFSRGCRFNCTYCFKIWPGNRYVNRSAGDMFKELELYYRIGIRRFTFVDDLPNFNAAESSRFYRMIAKNCPGIQLFYPNGLRGDILTEDYIDLMMEAGTVSLDLALETTSPRLQKLINKNLDLDRLFRNIHYIINQYPQCILETQLLHGIPGETEAEARNSLDFLKSQRWIPFPYLHVLKIYPGTRMAELAMEYGISRQAIERSDDLGYNELPETLPFSREFSRRYQQEFAGEYFMSRERLLAVLPYQIKALTEDELVQKYNSFLPVDIREFRDLLDYAGICPEELNETGQSEFLPADFGLVPDLHRRIGESFPEKKVKAGAVRVFLVDLAAYFSREQREVVYRVVEPPLGLLYLATHLRKKLGESVEVKVLASLIDFDSFHRLKEELENFAPHVIGIRTLNFFKDFFHQTVSLIRQWGIDCPILAGGPYATGSFRTILQDRNVDLAVLGEGEVTLSEIIEKMTANNNRLPDRQVLMGIPGIAFPGHRWETSGCNADRDIVLTDQGADLISRESSHRLDPVNRPGDIAYIMYTSGSSGDPKGVMIQHRNLVNQVWGLKARFHFDSRFHFILLSALNFDVSLMHIFSSLAAGAKLHLVPEEVRRDPSALLPLVRKYRVDVVNTVPAFLHAVLDSDGQDKCRLKYLFVGGDIFDPCLIKKINTRIHADKIINIYGPTEATINTALYECNGNEAMVPIGRPLNNYQAFILDRDLNLLPPGVAGELCIGGDGVARGYLNQPSLTNEKFSIPARHLDGAGLPIQYPFYRSGDFCRWLPDGDLLFLGRMDKQVKIRGIRVEPGEIEAHVLRHGAARQAVVTIREEDDGDQSPCCYWVPADGRVRTEPDWVSYLKKKLPFYMVPVHFVKMNEIPLTANGTVNYRGLPDPKSMGVDAAVHHNDRDRMRGPQDDMEKRLMELWSEVMGLDVHRIHRDSNFFQLGGHSLKGTILVSRIQKRMDIKIPLVELFKRPTITLLADFARSRIAEKQRPLEMTEEKEYYPLSSAQKRLYVLQQMDPAGTGYNLPLLVTLDGDLDRGKLAAGFTRLVMRHESFRTSFLLLEGEPRQLISRSLDFTIDYIEAAEAEAGKMAAGFIRPFDLERAPLFRVELIKVENGKHILMADMHHIISDGVSMRIFVSEFAALYGGSKLPAVPFQYRDFSEWQNRLIRAGTMQKQKEYWLKRFADGVPRFDIPTDYPRPTARRFRGDTVFFDADSDLTGRVEAFVKDTRSTMHILLLAVFSLLLCRYTGSRDVVVGAPVSGRRHHDLEGIIGMFVNLLPMRNYPDSRKTFKAFLEEVRNHSLDDYENQDYPFDSLVGHLGIAGEGGGGQLVRAVLEFVNLEDLSAIRIPGLRVDPYESDYPIAKFDLTLTAYIKDGCLNFELEYSADLFRKETVERMGRHLVRLLSAVIDRPELPLGRLDMLAPGERLHLARGTGSRSAADSESKADRKIEADFEF